MWTAVLLAGVGLLPAQAGGAVAAGAGAGHPTVERVADLIPVALLSALVAVQVFSTGPELVRRTRAGPRLRRGGPAAAHAVPRRGRGGVGRGGRGSPRLTPPPASAASADGDGTPRGRNGVLLRGVPSPSAEAAEAGEGAYQRPTTVRDRSPPGSPVASAQGRPRVYAVLTRHRDPHRPAVPPGGRAPATPSWPAHVDPSRERSPDGHRRRAPARSRRAPRSPRQAHRERLLDPGRGHDTSELRRPRHVVSRAASSPPVSDSAVAIVSPRSARGRAVDPRRVRSIRWPRR